ncbi:phosphotransferase family protein [Methylobrevis pamukkalensis]|uniref:Choline/ethanolamine kinase n=1 Tax=Methylobrevis pamukkalensis TaxID=1439726 RepID=A0A1E3H902_9HYPH|nr:Choline/ethanolamine kinase [Methylobrevis pamukkalensis]
MVFAHLDGRSLTADDVRADWPRVVDLLRRVHGGLARHLTGPAPCFWVFHVLRDYAATIAAGNGRPAADLARFTDLAGRLEAAQVPLPVTFGHHDLLPANIFEAGGRLWLIDWEYGGFGTAMFDLANLAGNAGLEPGEDEALLAAWFDAPDPAIRRAFAAMKVASLLREAMWSMVGELHMTAPGVDYAAYSAETLARFEAALAAFEDDGR